MYNIKIYTPIPYAWYNLVDVDGNNLVDVDGNNLLAIVDLWGGSLEFKKTLSNNKLSSRIKITNEINVWYGNFNFTYNSDEMDDVICGDVVKVYKWSTAIYFGKVTNKTVNLQWGGITQEIQCKGYQTILNDFYYSSAGNYTFTKNDDPKNLITDIVGQSDTEVTYFSTDYSNMSLVWSNVSISFDNETLMQALQKVLATTTYYYSLRPDWTIYFDELPTTNDHALTFKNDIRWINIEYNSDELVNDIYLAYDGGTTTGENTNSKFAYGTRKSRITDTTIKNLATADAYIAVLLEDKASVKDTIRIDINNSYDTTTLYPWQMISVSNCPIAIKNKIIRRVEYNDQWASVYLNVKETIEKSLSKLIN